MGENLRCPSCGGEHAEDFIPLPDRYPEFEAVVCRDCGMRGPKSAWNTRTSGPALKAVLELIRDCLDVAGVAEVTIDEETARAILAEFQAAGGVVAERDAARADVARLLAAAKYWRKIAYVYGIKINNGSEVKHDAAIAEHEAAAGGIG